MNTKTIIGSLLPLLTTSLFAQDIRLQAGATPDACIAAVSGAKPGMMVVLLLGTHAGPAKLPNGQLLGIDDAYIAAARAAVEGTTMLGTYFDRGGMRVGTTFLAQAAVVDFALPFDSREAIQVSKAVSVEVQAAR